VQLEFKFVDVSLQFSLFGDDCRELSLCHINYRVLDVIQKKSLRKFKFVFRQEPHELEESPTNEQEEAIRG
jgi:hypothetical protein